MAKLKTTYFCSNCGNESPCAQMLRARSPQPLSVAPPSVLAKVTYGVLGRLRDRAQKSAAAVP